MEILSKGARFKDAFCATCDVFAYDLDEKGDPDNCYMFKKPTSNVDGDMVDATISTAYVRSSDVWLVAQEETVCEE